MRNIFFFFVGTGFCTSLSVSEFSFFPFDQNPEIPFSLFSVFTFYYSTMYGKGSFPNDSSSSNNRIEPNFFHTSATRHNTPNKKDNSQDHAETPYWQSPPPYSEHANYPPAISDTDNHAPSAPPLELAQSDVISPYPPQPQVYPPLNYDNNNPHGPTTGYPTYGSFPQPPYHNTPDVLQPSSMPSWPWVAPPRCMYA